MSTVKPRLSNTVLTKALILNLNITKTFLNDMCGRVKLFRIDLTVEKIVSVS